MLITANVIVIPKVCYLIQLLVLGWIKFDQIFLYKEDLPKSCFNAVVLPKIIFSWLSGPDNIEFKALKDKQESGVEAFKSLNSLF